VFLTATCYVCFAQEQKQRLFQGEVNADDINIRSDSTMGSEIICKMNKNESIDVITQAYDWYKIRLPQNAPSFIKKDLVSPTEGKTAKVLKDNVNIRLRPDTASAILGRVNTDDTVNILEENGEWYKIEPVKNSFGWIHKNFLNKVQEKKIKLASEKNNEPIKETITVEGLIKPKTITSVATHKLTTEDRKLYLLNSSQEDLSSFNNRRVKISGKVDDPTKPNPIIEVEKIEALD
jgi:uncharacterized protein YgiM (DUF1202 family)